VVRELLTQQDMDLIDALASWSGQSWTPRPYDKYVIVLSPLVRRSSGAANQVTWAEAAANLDVPLEQITRGRPSFRRLARAAEAQGVSEWYTWPDEGVITPEVWSQMGPILAESARYATSLAVGFYLGYGTPQALLGKMQPAQVLGLSYGFARFPSEAVYRSPGGIAAQPLVDPTPLTVSPDIGFLWPPDQQWLLQCDPDCPYLTVGCDPRTAARLINHPALDCWVGSPGGPSGQHVAS